MKSTLIILVGLLLAACGGAVDPTTVVDPTATASTTADPTPSSTPTEEQSPSLSASGGWRAFLMRQSTTSDEYVEHYEALTEAASSGESIQLGLAALELMVWAEDQRDWLLENPPDDCYAEAWREAVEWMDLAYDFADLSGDVANDPSDGMSANLALSVGDDVIDAMGRVGDEIEAASC